MTDLDREESMEENAVTVPQMRYFAGEKAIYMAHNQSAIGEELSRKVNPGTDSGSVAIGDANEPLEVA